MQVDERIGRGFEASGLLEPRSVLSEALAAVEARVVGTLRTSPDEGKRNEAYYLGRAIDELKAELKRIVGDGRLASQQKGTT